MEMKKRIDPDFKSYETFFDLRWSRKINGIAEGTIADRIVLDLTLAWKGAGNTHRLPWLVVEMLRGFQSSFMKADDPVMMKLVRALLTTCEAVVGESMTDDAVEKLQKFLRSKVLEFGMQKQQLADEFDSKAVWDDFLTKSEFQISLWGSQRIVYGALYYAYEDFLIRCFKHATQSSKYRIKREQFERDCERLFDRATLDSCWTDPRIQTARLIRNALVHNGGRLTSELRSKRHGIVIEDGELQIMAADTRALFDVLKIPALKLTGQLVEKYSQLPVLQDN